MTNIVELGTKPTAIERICLMLDNKEITGAKLARELGISTSTLSQVKNGTYAADTAAIEEKLLSAGLREVLSQQLGELVMAELKKLDKVAYIRFASVYRNFEDVDAFSRAIKEVSPSARKK